MSASTQTAQRSLGIGQLGAALVVVALILAVAVAIAFGSLGASKAIPAAGTAPIELTRGTTEFGTGAAAPVEVMPKSEYGSGAPFGAGSQADPGYAPRTPAGESGGSNGPRLRPQ